MSAPESPSSNSLRYFVGGVLCVAVLLGLYFVQLNAQVDREREQLNERLALCRQIESVARSVHPSGLEVRDACEHMGGHAAKSATPL
ncbi:hypothetical protein ACW9IB_17790 [Pseudomonas sp. SDO524_S393]